MKPLEFSPRQCASRGWICEGKDLLKCSDCRQFLVCSLPPLYDILLCKFKDIVKSWLENSYLLSDNKCVEKIKDGLTSGHSTTCQWRSSPVSGEFLVFKFVFDLCSSS